MVKYGFLRKFRTPRAALMIDTENISPKYAEMIFREADRAGKVITKKGYGDFAQSSVQAWKRYFMLWGLSTEVCFPACPGKSSADMKLMLDAEDMVNNRKVDVLCIASSDSDFTVLAKRAREAGVKVVGMGESKSPELYREACTEFIVLDQEKQDHVMEDLEEIRPILEEVMAESAVEDGWSLVSPIGKKMKQRMDGFSSERYGYASLTQLLKAMGYEVESRPRGNGAAAMARKRREAPENAAYDACA